MARPPDTCPSRGKPPVMGIAHCDASRIGFSQGHH